MNAVMDARGSAEQAAVEVVVHDGERTHPAVRWAAREAHRRGAPLRVVASAHTGSGATADLLRTRSVDAGLLVVPTDLPALDRVVAEAYCPVAAVPRRPSPPGGSVVVGVAPWTTEDTVALAFIEAATRRVRLVAVRAWDRPGVDLGWLHPERIAEWDRASGRARQELEWALSARRVVHPEVPVEVIVAQDSPTELLLALTTRARLLVLGRSCRGTLLAGITGSPVSDLLRAVRCPVVVVPAEGRLRSSWWPSRAHGWMVAAHP